MSARMLRAALVSMPFTSVYHPSIQLGLLKAIAAREGFSVDTFHFNLNFAHRIGLKRFEALCEGQARRDGEWLFATEAFGSHAPDRNGAYLEAFRQEIAALLENGVEEFRSLKEQSVPLFLEELVTRVDWTRYQVVGFTSTFQQNNASFALARRIKERCPHVITLFGGANFDGEMGLEFAKSIECIDYAVIGEGDDAFPDFLKAIDAGVDPLTVPGVVGKSGSTMPALRPRAPFRRLADVPTPDYFEYFEQARRFGVIAQDGEDAIAIPFEASRGCWWGEKRHCIFCGLNAETMAFREKPAQRVLDELSELASRHKSFRFVAVDNILSPRHLREVLDRLADEQIDFELFYEVKSNLNRQRLHRLQQGGVKWIQPGIESLNSRILKIMRKGVSAIHNVNTLRWAQYYGINAVWNLLYGFPGEQQTDYAEQLQLLRKLAHLRPPHYCGRIWMERFSPIFFDDAAFPAKLKVPERSHRFVYPATVDLTRAAYYFDHEFAESLPEETYATTHAAVKEWQERWSDAARVPQMTFRATNDFVLIDDRRDAARRSSHYLEETAAMLYIKCCDAPRGVKSLLDGSAQVDSNVVIAALEGLVEQGLMISDDGLFLSLAIPSTGSRPGQETAT